MMIHTDSDEGPVPVEVLQSRAAKAKEADLAAALQRAEQAASSMNLAHEDLIELTERYDALLGDLAAARRERDRLQAFKTWCHDYLDAHGVPHHPPGTHGAEGCRIGDRLDWLFTERDAARRERDAMEERAILAEQEWDNWRYTAEKAGEENGRLRAALEKANG